MPRSNLLELCKEWIAGCHAYVLVSMSSNRLTESRTCLRVRKHGTRWTNIALVVVLAAGGLSASGQDSKPNLAVVTEAGKASLARASSEPANWIVSSEIPSGGKFVIQVNSVPGMRRTSLSFERAGRRDELIRIVSRDGFWYVRDGKHTGKYRPFEAPFDLPTAYYHLLRVEPRFLTDPLTLRKSTYEGTNEKGFATYREPLPEATLRTLRAAVAQMEALPDRSPELEATLTRSRDLIKRGLSTLVDLKSGLILGMGTPERRIEVRELRWPGKVDSDLFRVDDFEWEDFSNDPTAGDTGELVMIANSATWQPGMKNSETDGRLVNLKTGRFRRIPFQGATSLPGCFLPGRRRVVISGLDTDTGQLGLYEVDLKTGENRMLGGEALAAGPTLFPVLSPKGKEIAALHSDPALGLAGMRVYRIDLLSGEALPIGKPGDLAYPSWLPDASGLILLVRTPDGKGDTVKTIARMDLDGTLTTLREGDRPLVLENKRILFSDPKSKHWKTCDLSGKDEKLYADGLKEYGFATASPDGKRLLMMHFQPGKAPVPTVLEIGASEGKPAITAPGLWTTPAWR